MREATDDELLGPWRDKRTYYACPRHAPGQPQYSPTSDRLTDYWLKHHWNRAVQVEGRARRDVRSVPSLRRYLLNVMLHDLHTEMVRRGFLNPME